MLKKVSILTFIFLSLLQVIEITPKDKQQKKQLSHSVDSFNLTKAKPEDLYALGMIHKQKGDKELAKKYFLLAADQGYFFALVEIDKICNEENDLDLAKKYNCPMIRRSVPNKDIVEQTSPTVEEELFFNAVTQGDLQAVQKFVKEGINLTRYNRMGETALHLAAEYEDFKYSFSENKELEAKQLNEKKLNIVKFLISSGADVNAKSQFEQCTPLVTACGNGSAQYPANIKAIQLLLAVPNIDINSPDEEGNTPLHLILREVEYKGVLSIVKQLMKKGANCYARNRNGETPLDIVKNKSCWYDPIFNSERQKIFKFLKRNN